MFEGLISYLLLPLGAALGFALGRERTDAAGRQDALNGMAHRVQDHTDAAITSLGKASATDPAAAELNLTLGALLRKRGEIDRALQLHEDVLAQVADKPDFRPLVLLELGQDYAKAGLTDRAEQVLSECAQHPPLATMALEHLLPLYEQHASWQAALDAAKRLAALRGQSTAVLQSHYLCELSEEAAAQPAQLALAQDLAEKALAKDPACVRASLWLATLHERQTQPTEALSCLMRVPEQDARFLSEALPRIQSICSSSGQDDTLQALLGHLEAQYGQDPAIWLMRASGMSAERQTVYLADKLSQRPSWGALVQFLSLPSALEEAGALARPMNAFRGAITQLIKKRPGYRCTHCGFTPSLLFWRCPSCKQWGTVVPAEDTL